MYLFIPFFFGRTIDLVLHYSWLDRNYCRNIPLITMPRHEVGAETLMPIVRYCLFVGILLLAVLFAADWYLPKPDESFALADVDRTIIRIHSARPLPEKVVFDTANPPVVPPSDLIAAGQLEDPPRQAFAMLPDARSTQAKPSPATIRVVDRRHASRARRVASRTPERRVALDHQDFFGGW
jgi:hypothetical protein